MTTTDLEQKATVTETEDESSDKETSQVSESAAEVSVTAEEAEQKEAEGDTQKRIQPDSQAQIRSEVDKAVNSYRDKLEESNRKVRDLEKTAEKAKKEIERAKLESQELDEWGDTPEVRSIQEVRRRQEQTQEELDEVRAEAKGFLDAAEEKTRDSKALSLAIQYGLPNGEELLKTLSSFVEEISKGKTPSDMELIALKAALNKPEGKKRFVHKPDSSKLTAPGGMDESKLKGSDAIRRGLEKLRKE